MPILLILCALLGYWVNGFVGLLIGVAVGYAITGLARARLGSAVRLVQSNFLDTSFAVMGALCKADGVVTRNEIRVTEQLFTRLRLTPDQREAAKAAFTRGKEPEFDLDAEVEKFVRATHGAPVLLQLFLQMQLLAVAADGEVHPAEHAMLVSVARGLGLSELDVARLEALLRASAAGPAADGGPRAEQRLDDAYTALGVTREATETEIKRAYRKLISENHPDRLAAQGLPESMRAIAEERARELNVAYELIKKSRQFT